MAILGMMGGVLFLTQAQQVDLFGVNFYAIRFLEVAGFLRVAIDKKLPFCQLNGIDHAFLWLYGFTILVFLIRSTESIATQIGITLDAFFCYFIFRKLIIGMDDLRWFLRSFVILLAPYTVLVLIEITTAHNPFALLGGIEGGSDWMRHGIPRCFGSFRQPDTLGMFGASFLPLYISSVFDEKERKNALLGISLCLTLIACANSGGPILGGLTGLLAWGLWRIKKRMRMVRWGIVASIILLALVMKDPVWYIFAHASGLTGGSGWHRSKLIDVVYRNIDQWWLAGMPLGDTIDWFPYVLPQVGTADITNAFIAFGLTSGICSVFLFIRLLSKTYNRLGLALENVRSFHSATRETELMFWGLGVMLTVHIINWFGCTYFDQMYVIWFMHLAVIATLTEVYAGQPATDPDSQSQNAPEIHSSWRAMT